MRKVSIEEKIKYLKEHENEEIIIIFDYEKYIEETGDRYFWGLGENFIRNKFVSCSEFSSIGFRRVSNDSNDSKSFHFKESFFLGYDSLPYLRIKNLEKEKYIQEELEF